ncbi:unnamed protein product [Ectocarpus sp. 6 AP-2014]
MPATTPRERGARRVRTKAAQRRPSGGSDSLAASHAEPAPAFNAGINPLYGSGMSPEAGAEAARIRSATAAREASAASSSSSQPQQQPRAAAAARAARTRAASPQSTLTASTTQSTGSARLASRPQGVAPPPAKATMTAGAKKQPQETRSAPASRNGSINKGSSGNNNNNNNNNNNKGEFVPAPLVPALLAPVPPPPAKRRAAADIEAGEAGEVLEDAPDKTLMEMLQTYLKKQDLYTRIVLVVVLLVLAGGVLGAYVVMLWSAIAEKSVKFTVLVSVFSVVLLWVLWKYCFSGDQKLQDQSQIAQDIATLYAAIPDHTAVKGVSEKGRAQFTDFKYEKSEMMFTAVTDDGVSLGSERGSELMMDGADPSCPLCNKAYVEGAELCLLPCLHVFHKTCIHKWCNRHIVCPLCKRHLEAAEPLHTLTASYNHPSGNAVQSEPGHRGYGNGQQRHQWRGVPGNTAPGPASAHGSERGLGGTRSEDGMWNDRVLNAAQQQQMGGKHNRVTSFSSETRRSNNARGRPGERVGSGRGGGPPHSSSAGAGMGPQRAQSVSGSTSWQQQQQQQNHRLQRKRSSSFTTATEQQRGRGGSGRVAHGTARHRSSAGSLARGDLSTSPRSRSDLGVGSRDAENMRANSDAMLSRHASRRNNGAGGTKTLTMKPMFHDDTGGTEAWDADGGGGGAEEVKGEPGRRMAAIASAPGRSGLHSSRQGPAVITVHKVQQNTRSSSGSGRRRPRRESGGGRRDSARWSGGESESDVGGGGGERVFSSRRMAHEDDSPEDDEVTTKALTYAPRKSRATAKDKKDPGHRRQSSTGSTSAEEFGGGGGGGSSKKSRRRPSIPGSKSGSGNQSAIATAAATAEAVSKLLGRSTPEDRSASVAAANAGARRSSITSDGYSDGDSGSDARASSRRNSRGSSSSVRAGGSKRTVHPQQPQQSQQPQQPQQHSQQLKNTPTKTGPVTKGTPAPPMAAARVATWNSTSAALAPTVDVSQSLSMSETECSGPGSNPAAATAAAAAGGGGGGGGGGTQGEADAAAREAGVGVGSSPSAEMKGSGGRGWSFKIPASVGSAEFFGLGSSVPGTRKNSADAADAAAGAAGAEGDSDRERDGSSSRSSSLRIRVLSGRKSGSGKVGAPTGRLFGSSTARVGRPPGNSTSGEAGASGVESAGEHAGGGIGSLRSSNSVQALIQTYEKKDRSSSDEKAPTAQQEEWPLPAPTTSSTEGKRRISKTVGSRRRGTGSTARDEQAATESEIDEEYVDRPKLSYKKKSSRSSVARSVFATADGPSTQNAIHAVQFRSVGGGRRGKAGETDGDSDGGGEDDDEPYERPKLSYGGGLRSGPSSR